MSGIGYGVVAGATRNQMISSPIGGATGSIALGRNAAIRVVVATLHASLAASTNNGMSLGRRSEADSASPKPAGRLCF